MTYSEYIEKNNVSFTDAMELFNGSKYSSFDVFLKSEYNSFKFRIDDIVVLQLNDYVKEHLWCRNVVFKIVKTYSACYKVKYLTPDGDFNINDERTFPKDFIEDNCKLY